MSHCRLESIRGVVWRQDLVRIWPGAVFHEVVSSYTVGVRELTGVVFQARYEAYISTG